MHDPLDAFVKAVRRAAKRVDTPAARRSLAAVNQLAPVVRRRAEPRITIPDPPQPAPRSDPHAAGEPDPALAFLYEARP